MKLESGSLLLSNREIAGFLKKTCQKGIPFKFTAKGMSMSPFICDGDALIIEPICKIKRIEKGDIVACISPVEGHLIIHRVIKKQNGQYLLKGDNVYHCDGYCREKDIHGCVKKVIIMRKKIHTFHKLIRKIFLFLNNFKKIIAFSSRYKLLTPVCRMTSRFI